MKMNLKGINKESIVGIVVLIVALVNAILQMLGIQTLPISNEDIDNAISIIFLIGSTIYSVYKNFNITPASQTAQKITDAIKNGEILIDQVEAIIDKCKTENAENDTK